MINTPTAGWGRPLSFRLARPHEALSSCEMMWFRISGTEMKSESPARISTIGRIWHQAEAHAMANVALCGAWWRGDGGGAVRTGQMESVTHKRTVEHPHVGRQTAQPLQAFCDFVVLQQGLS